MIGILLFLSFFCDFILDPQDINTIVSNFGGYIKNHTINLASVEINLHSHVIHRGNSFFALCSIENASALEVDEISFSCNFNLYMKESVISQAKCQIGPKQSKCVAEIYPEHEFFYINSDYITFDLAYSVTAFDKNNVHLQDITKGLIYKDGRMPVYMVLRGDDNHQVLGNDHVRIQVENQTLSQIFALDLTLSSDVNFYYFEIGLPPNVDYEKYNIRNDNEAWIVKDLAIADGVYAFNLTHDNMSSSKSRIGLNIEIILKTHLGFRRGDLIFDKMELLTINHQTDLPTKFTLRTPRILPNSKALYVFTQFKSSDIIQIPWLTKSLETRAQPRKLNVIGYIPHKREFLDLTDKVHCRIAQNKLSSSQATIFSRLIHSNNLTPCPANMRQSGADVENPLPNSSGLPNKEDAYGTGIEFPEQIVLSLGHMDYQVVPDPVFGYPHNTDWSWRAWRGPYTRIWHVDGLTIEMDRDHLARIENWWYSKSLSDVVFLKQPSNGERIQMTGPGTDGFIDLTSYLTPENIRLDTSPQSESVAQIFWSNITQGPMIAGRNVGQTKVNLITEDGQMILTSRRIIVSDERPKSVVSMQALCGNPEVTFAGSLEEHRILTRPDQSILNYPQPQRLTLSPDNELLRTTLFSQQGKNLIKDVYTKQDNDDVGILVKSPGQSRLNDSCEVNKVMVNLIMNDNSKMSLTHAMIGRVRLTAKLKGDYHLTWDPARRILEDSTDKQFMPSIHLASLQVWSNSKQCSQSIVIFPTKEERKLSVPIVAMDEPFKEAQLSGKWTDPDQINNHIYRHPHEISAYFKNLMETLKGNSGGNEHQQQEKQTSFDNRIIYGIIAAILLIAAILMIIQVKTIVKYKRKKNSSMLNGSSGNCYKNPEANVGGQNQTYTDLTHSPLVVQQNTLTSNHQDPMSCCSLASSTILKGHQQPLFISPQNSIQNGQFCGQASPSSMQMTGTGAEAFCQNVAGQMGTPLLMTQNATAISPLMCSMQTRISPDMGQNQLMWTSQMQNGSNQYNQHYPKLANNKLTNGQFNRYDGGSLSSTSDLNLTNQSSNIFPKQYDINCNGSSNSFRVSSPMNRQCTASPLVQQTTNNSSTNGSNNNNNWNFNQLLPYSLPENPDGNATTKLIGYTNSNLGSMGTCSDEGIGTASSPHHRCNSEFITANSLSSSCGWSNLGNSSNKMLINNTMTTNSNDDGGRFICPPPMECLSTVKNSITSRTSSMKNSSTTFRSDLNEFSTSILPPPVHMSSSSREHSQTSNHVPKSFIQPSDSSDVIVSMMGDVFGYETDTSRTNSMSKLENLSAIPTEL